MGQQIFVMTEALSHVLSPLRTFSPGSCSVDFSQNELPKNGDMTLRVNTTGHVLHVFVNKNLVGSQWAKDGKYIFVFEQSVERYFLLSAIVGLANYGGFYDLIPAGIVGGPVKLLGTGNVSPTDISSNGWSYKVGLTGEMNKFYDVNSNGSWSDGELSINKPLTWYKSTFQAPLGRDPVVVGLKGLGKGQAWVNGRSIGRFWPSFLAQANGCTATCDYRGPYKSDKCLTNCGHTTQRWYHVPRSFLDDDGENTLVLFEELGGDPTAVNFQTVTVGKAKERK
ncbi:hypothetical protein ACHQM5_018972 [Ranunculus cassubicifolius]